MRQPLSFIRVSQSPQAGHLGDCHVATTNYFPCGRFRARHLVLSNRRLGASYPCRRSRRRPKLGSNRELPCRRLGWVQPNAQRESEKLSRERAAHTRGTNQKLVELPSRRPYRLREVANFLAHVHRASELP